MSGIIFFGLCAHCRNRFVISIAGIRDSISTRWSEVGGRTTTESLEAFVFRFSTKEFITGFCSYNADCVNWMSFCSFNVQSIPSFHISAFDDCVRATKFHFTFFFFLFASLFFLWAPKCVRARTDFDLNEKWIPTTFRCSNSRRMWCEWDNKCTEAAKIPREKNTLKDTIFISDCDQYMVCGSGGALARPSSHSEDTHTKKTEIYGEIKIKYWFE